jgi:hypothetical protein
MIKKVEICSVSIWPCCFDRIVRFVYFRLSDLAAIIFSLKNITNIGLRVVVIIYIHKLMLIRILSSDWPISIQVPSKLGACLEQEVDKILV